MRIVIAPDSFKSTATTQEAGQYLAEGVRQGLEEAGIAPDSVSITVVPMADGGEGSASTFSGETITLPTTDANGRLTEASYVFDPAQGTAYIDLAAASGLPQVSDSLDPMKADTYGTGVLIADAQTRGAQRVVLCLGGSATTDGGTGILVALGAQPHTAEGLPARQGGAGLRSIDSIDTAQLNIPAAALEWVLLTDVTNPATGPEGAAAVFGPQKGANPEQVEELDAGLAHLCERLGVEPSTPGLGAAGGTPIGLLWLSSILHGSSEHVHMLPGAQVIAQSTGLDALAKEADLIITGEGSFDSQSLRGKVVGTILELAGEETAVAIAAGSIDSAPEGVIAFELPDAPVREQLATAGRKIIAEYLA